MSVIINDTGFVSNDINAELLVWEDGELRESDGKTAFAIDLPNTAEPTDLTGYFDQAVMIRIAFPSFADGRGFTLARQLRQLGYQGHLRAHGHVISDQYAMIRRCGFDDVEISDEQAQRQPAADWKFRANWQDHNYQTMLQDAG